MALNVADFLKTANNTFGTIASDTVCGDVNVWIDTGSYAFNALVSGSIYKGVPANKILGLIGEESTGKTYFALAAAKHFQDANPDASVIYFETESALTTEMLDSRGIDKSRFLSLPVATVQDFKNQCLRIVDKIIEDGSDTKVLVCLDSLGNLSTTKEMEDSAAGSDTRDMTRAQIIKAAFRVLALKLGAANIPMIFTNHVYAQIGAGPYAGKTQSGGSGAKYAASIIVNLTKAKDKDGDDHTGSIITCTAIKSRLTREGTKVKARIRFNGGLDRYYGLLTLAEECGIFKKVSTKYELPDGRKFFGKTLEREPEKYFTQDVLDAIEEYVQREFRYGVNTRTETIDDQGSDSRSETEE